MTNEQFKSLRRGDVIRGLCSGTAFVVDAHYGDFVIAMKSMHVSNPSEWELCASENSGAVDNSIQQRHAGRSTAPNLRSANFVIARTYAIVNRS
jgi:hypothetical protein